MSFSYVSGRLKRITYPDNDYVEYGYDPAGNLQTVSSPTDGSYVTYSSLDAMGHPHDALYGNGAVSHSDYNGITKRLEGLKVDTFVPPSATLVHLLDNNYDYDNKGNIKTITDKLNKPIPPSSFTSDSYTTAPGHAHAITPTDSSRVFHYDPNGNLDSYGQRTIIYDYDNMPATINNNVTFTYDGSGTRVKKVGQYGVTIYFDKLYVCTNDYCDKHIYADDGLIAIKTAAQTFYHHRDHQGSTAAVTRMDGTPAKSFAYDPFGGTPPDVSPPYLDYKYTGQEQDRETGLYNYGARLYDPDLGRFLTPDSIVPDPEDPQSLNRFSYVRNNPINSVDPTGHFDYDFENGFSTGYGSSYDASMVLYNSSSYNYSSSYNSSYSGSVNNAWSSYYTPNNTVGGPSDSWSNGNLSNSPSISAPPGMMQSAKDYLNTALYNFRNNEHGARIDAGMFLIGLVAAPEEGVEQAAAKLLPAGVKALKSADRVFWSGGIQAKQAAEAYAKAIGGKTLEMTLPGKILNALTTNRTYPLLRPLWEKASLNFAKNAEGAVDVFHSASRGVSLDSVWAQIEYPQLMKQGNPINYFLAP